MLTFMVPAQLRRTFGQHQKQMYDLLIKASWQTIDSFARRDPMLKGRIGAHADLHAHHRKLEYHPHLHMIVPAGAVDEKQGQWRCKTEDYLFPVTNLAKVFRAKMDDGDKALYPFRGRDGLERPLAQLNP
jgi:hypothetical protein